MTIYQLLAPICSEASLMRMEYFASRGWRDYYIMERLGKKKLVKRRVN